MRQALAVAVIAMGLAAATGSLWVEEHQSLEHQLWAMRSYHGLPYLPEDPALTDAATEHSWQMARSLRLFHASDATLAQTPGEWEAVGETVGVAAQPWKVVRAFMDSPDHRALLLGDWTAVGFGHIRADGRVWVTLRFRR